MVFYFADVSESSGNEEDDDSDAVSEVFPLLASLHDIRSVDNK